MGPLMFRRRHRKSPATTKGRVRLNSHRNAFLAPDSVRFLRSAFLGSYEIVVTGGARGDVNEKCTTLKLPLL